MGSKLTTNSGTDVTDKMRFFHGDSPARELECGQQKGGNYYCSGCGAYAQRVYELDYCFRCRWMSLSDRQQLMLNGPYGQKNYLAKAYKPLQKLKKQELIAELNSRRIFEGETKSELEKLLQDEMHGFQRVPVLLYNTPTTSLESFNCENYETISFEPLHDIGKHIENVLTELPAHLPAEEAKDIEEVIKLSMEGKDTKRTFEYRRAIVILTQHSVKISSHRIRQLLTSLVEIQRLAYSSESERTPKSVLRLHNMTWYHGILCQEVFGFKLKEMTTRKLYGNYFHDITSHAAMQHRLISGRSTNVEEQERVFNTITNITKATSSFHPSHIIGNIFVRLQAEKQMAAFQSSCISKQEATGHHMDYGNTIIPHEIIEKHIRSWQAHLERVSDFLLTGKGSWWMEHENGDIEFYDGEQPPDNHSGGPSLHHFRSSNFKSEEKYLEECWEKCLRSGVTLPIKVLRIEDEHGNMNVVQHSSVNRLEMESDYNLEPEQHNAEFMDSTIAEHEMQASVATKTTEENILTFELVPDNVSELPLDALDDNVCNDEKNQQESVVSVPIDSVPQQNTSVITNDNPPDQTTDMDRNGSCITKIGRFLEFVLGRTAEVVRFDNARQRHKQSPNDTDYAKDHMKQVAIMEIRLSKQQRHYKAQLSQWERDFFIQHNCKVATQDDIASCQDAKLLVKKLKYAKALLNKFKEK
jgi:hypothetical protein